jgi:hypothetical protein
MTQQIIDTYDSKIIGQDFCGAISDHISRFVLKSSHGRILSLFRHA